MSHNFAREASKQYVAVEALLRTLDTAGSASGRTYGRQVGDRRPKASGARETSLIRRYRRDVTATTQIFLVSQPSLSSSLHSYVTAGSNTMTEERWPPLSRIKWKASATGTLVRLLSSRSTSLSTPLFPLYLATRPPHARRRATTGWRSRLSILLNNLSSRN